MMMYGCIHIWYACIYTYNIARKAKRKWIKLKPKLDKKTLSLSTMIPKITNCELVYYNYNDSIYVFGGVFRHKQHSNDLCEYNTQQVDIYKMEISINARH